MQPSRLHLCFAFGRFRNDMWTECGISWLKNLSIFVIPSQQIPLPTHIILFFLFSSPVTLQQTISGLRCLVDDLSRWHARTHGRTRLNELSSSIKHTKKYIKGENPCTQRDLNPQSQHPSRCKPTHSHVDRLVATQWENEKVVGHFRTSIN